MGDIGASGQMIALAREAKGWRQSDLARAAGMAQGSVSKVERGLLALDEEGLTKVADVLEVPGSLLRGDHELHGMESTCLHNRRRASRMPVATLKRVEGLAQLVALSTKLLLQHEPVPVLVRQPPESCLAPPQVARALRLAWRVPSGPVDDLVGLLERMGVIVVVRGLGTDAQDAVSLWPAGAAPVVLLNTGLPPDRARFTLAHELGHLVLHGVPGEGQEDEANAFAAELLTPADAIRPELEGLTLRDFGRLARLKSRWKVSMAALIQRAHQLDCISPSQFKSFRIKLNQYGWAKREPGELVPEVPTALTAAIEKHLADGLGVEELAELALMRPEQFRRHYLPVDEPPRHAATRNL
ncbi:helix-turn-helix domain-containing protein [Saccharothrix sp. HUAS TT1]|uniref:helix-turn-helix domain-containing protein n=1 Tax=unclassified Saccharothrix TaxID=2593673 RepID=UPI00345BCCF5